MATSSFAAPPVSSQPLSAPPATISLTRFLIESFLVEQAGGAATDGRRRMLEIAPTELHQRVPVFMGSRNEVEIATPYHLDSDADACADAAGAAARA